MPADTKVNNHVAAFSLYGRQPHVNCLMSPSTSSYYIYVRTILMAVCLSPPAQFTSPPPSHHKHTVLSAHLFSRLISLSRVIDPPSTYYLEAAAAAAVSSLYFLPMLQPSYSSLKANKTPRRRERKRRKRLRNRWQKNATLISD